MRVHIANRVLSGFSAILSLALLAICIWILASILIQQSNMKCSWEHHNVLCNDSAESSSHSFEDETHVVVIDNDEIKKPKLKHRSSSSSQLLTKFDVMSSKFKAYIIISLSGVIFGALVQFICSCVLIFSPSYKIPYRSRRVVYVYFSVCIIFLVGFAWPIAYKREYEYGEEDDDLHTMPTLSSAFMKLVNEFEWGKLVTDLYLYYIGVFSNILFLFIYMVVSCCLLRCADYEYYDI